MKHRLFLYAGLLVAMLGVGGCGGDGGGGEPAPGDSGGGGGSTTAPSTSVPFVAGKRWLYDVDRTNTVVATSTGVQTFKFVGERMLRAEQELTWQGRTAWRLAQYDLQSNPGASPGFNVATIYVSQGPDGLDKWVDTSTGGEWRRMLSTQALSFNNNTFLMAGGPAHGQGTGLSSPWPIAVPAGDYLTVLAYHQFKQTGPLEPEDIFEERWEYYADGVGLIKAVWDYSFDDNDPKGTDLMSVGTVDLKGIDTGPAVLSEVEPNDNGTAAASQRVTVGNIVAAQTQLSDLGRIVADDNVAANVKLEKLIQDWYRLELPAAGPRHIALVYDLFTNANFNDLDLYLFREGVGGTITFVNRSVLDPTTSEGRDGEWIQESNLPAGTYYIAVQAWNTPTDSVKYWINVR